MSTLPVYDDSDYADEQRERPTPARARRNALTALSLSLASTVLFITMQVIYWTSTTVADLVVSGDANAVLVSTLLVATAVGLGLFGIIRSVVCISQSGLTALTGIALVLGAAGPVLSVFLMPR